MPIPDWIGDQHDPRAFELRIGVPEGAGLPEVRAALRDGASALRRRAREIDFNTDALYNATTVLHCQRLRQSAALLDQLANELALAPDVTPAPDQVGGEHP